MVALVSGCRRTAAVAAWIVLGAILLPTAYVGPARADATYEFKGEAPSSNSRGQQVSQRITHSKRMRLGAVAPKLTGESLTGGTRRISRGKSTRKSRAATQSRNRAAVRTASLGDSYAPAPGTDRSLTGRRVTWGASARCLNAGLRAVVEQVASNFGPVTVNSTCRSRRHNARVRGARHSHHLSGNAVDFRVRGASLRAVYSFLRSHGSVGGLKLYRRGFFHIDTGSRRTW